MVQEFSCHKTILFQKDKICMLYGLQRHSHTAIIRAGSLSLYIYRYTHTQAQCTRVLIMYVGVREWKRFSHFTLLSTHTHTHTSKLASARPCLRVFSEGWRRKGDGGRVRRAEATRYGARRSAARFADSLCSHECQQQH